MVADETHDTHDERPNDKMGWGMRFAHGALFLIACISKGRDTPALYFKGWKDHNDYMSYERSISSRTPKLIAKQHVHQLTAVILLYPPFITNVFHRPLLYVLHPNLRLRTISDTHSLPPPSPSPLHNLEYINALHTAQHH